jgi:hypothetical protein
VSIRVALPAKPILSPLVLQTGELQLLLLSMSVSFFDAAVRVAKMTIVLSFFFYRY